MVKLVQQHRHSLNHGFYTIESIASHDAKKKWGSWPDDQHYDGSAESTGIENLLIQLYKTNSLRASDAFLARCEMILSSEITGLGIE